MDIYRHTNALVDIKSTMGWLLMNEKPSAERDEKLWELVQRIDEEADKSHVMEKEQEAILRNMLSINDKAINVDNYACGAYHECACGEMQALFQSIDQAIFHLIGDNEQLKSLFRELHKPR